MAVDAEPARAACGDMESLPVLGIGYGVSAVVICYYRTAQPSHRCYAGQTVPGQTIHILRIRMSNYCYAEPKPMTGTTYTWNPYTE